MGGRIATKWQDATFEVLIKDELRYIQKFLTSVSLREQRDAVKDFCLRDRGCEELMPWLGFEPSDDDLVRFLPQDF